MGLNNRGRMEVEDPVLEHHFKGHKGPVNCLTFNPAQRQLASGSKDSTIMIWNFRKNTRAFRFYGHKDAILDMSYAPSGQLLASASADCTVRIWTPSPHGSATEINAHISPVRSIHFSPDGQYIVTASNDKSIKIWAPGRRSKFISSMTGHGNWVRCARFSPDGRLVASCSDDLSLRLFDVRDKNVSKSKPIHIYMESKGTPKKVAFHPSGTCIAVALAQGKGGAVKIYDIRSHKLLQYYACHEQGHTNDVSFHPNGDHLTSASDDSTVKILDLMNGVPAYTLHGHSAPVLCAQFSPMGDNLATGGVDNQILVWKTKLQTKMDALKGTLSNPVKELSKGIAEMEIASGKSNLIDARSSILNPEETDVQIIDVSPATGGGDTKERDEVGESCTGDCIHMKTILNMNEQIETLRQTVTLLEQRLTLVEDQIQYRESISS
ncbi:hypothetical protein J437_LFUL012733 [Ladona fulva]|uniref:Uncharacterized protein n=1 Tax=Ladona fulva TaxID=123851 RepID=A0A8K0KNY9_LADFU|nr:hypothetical protein J437_LFUL012733 [Ladona fulva]